MFLGNNDFEANNLDAIELFQKAMDRKEIWSANEYEDMFADGIVSNMDATILFAWTLGLIPEIPVWPED